MPKLPDEYVRSVFRMYSSKGDGPNAKDFIAPNLLMHALQQLGQNPTYGSIEEICEKMDTDGDGTVDCEEFLTFYRSLEDTAPTEDALRTAFAAFDVDGSGALSKEELYDALTSQGEALSREELDLVFANFDLDGDGTIDYSEFVKLMMDRCTQPPSLGPAMLANYKLQQERTKQMRTPKEELLQEKQRARGTDLVEWFRDTSISFDTYSNAHVDSLLSFSEEVALAAKVNPKDTLAAGFIPCTFTFEKAEPFTIHLCKECSVCDARVLVAAHFGLEVNRIVLSVNGYNVTRIRGGRMSPFIAVALAAQYETSLRDISVEVIRLENAHLGPVVEAKGYDCLPAEGPSTMSLSAYFDIKVDSQMELMFPTNAAQFLTKIQVPMVELNHGQNHVENVSGAHTKKARGKRCFENGYYAFHTSPGVEHAPISSILIEDLPDVYVTNYLSLFRIDPHQQRWVRCPDSVILLNPTTRAILVVFSSITGTYRVDFSNHTLILNEDILEPRNDNMYPDEGKVATRGGRKYVEPNGWSRKGITRNTNESDANLRQWAAAYLGNETNIPASILQICEVRSSEPFVMSPSLPYVVWGGLFVGRKDLGENLLQEGWID
eukprot:PhF_6_TR26673/c4_g1_i1/m.38770